MSGVDAKGYIINPCSTIQVEYKSLVLDICSVIRENFSENLHSLHLYGSVARGTAKRDTSDVDFVILFKQPATDDELQILKDIERKFDKPPTGFDIGSVDEVLGEGQELFWQFFIKHCCLFLYGDDLSCDFNKVKPSLALTQKLNQGLVKKLVNLSDEMNVHNFVEQSVSISKQLIRSAYYLVIEKDKSFHHDINDCAQTFLKYYPEKASLVFVAQSYIDKKNSSEVELSNLITEFGNWISKETAI